MGLATLFDELRANAGIETVKEFGVIDRGRIGFSDYDASLRIEKFDEEYFVCVIVRHEKPGGSYTRVVKWPYSRTSTFDLDQVIADFLAIEDVEYRDIYSDSRGWFARGFDALTGVTCLGQYELKSTLQGGRSKRYPVSATAVTFGGAVQISLSEQRSPGVVTIAQIILESCGRLRSAINEYANSGKRSS
ncbi:MAG: hypothetical protein AB7O26_20915 [Planctomycetaceae bacterium]